MTITVSLMLNWRRSQTRQRYVPPTERPLTRRCVRGAEREGGPVTPAPRERGAAVNVSGRADQCRRSRQRDGDVDARVTTGASFTAVTVIDIAMFSQRCRRSL
jgi:hypothetical protein